MDESIRQSWEVAGITDIIASATVLGPALLINHMDGDDRSKHASIPAAPKQPSGIALVTVNSLSKHSFL